MSAHLSYEQCRALRDAGFPQGEIVVSCQPSTEMYWFENADGGTERIHWSDPEYANSPHVACPGSDELLAWMQDKWPDHEYEADFHKGGSVRLMKKQHEPPRPSALEDSMVQALCALALQLAHQEVTT